MRRQAGDNREDSGGKVQGGQVLTSCTHRQRAPSDYRLHTTLLSHLLTLGEQWDVEQSVRSLVQKVRVQNSDFTDVTQPDLGRRLPKALPHLEHTQEHRQRLGPNLKNNDGKRVKQ